MKIILSALLLLASATASAANLIQEQINGKVIEPVIQVPLKPPNRIVFGSLRSDAELSTIALIDPQGNVVWERPASTLLLLPSAQTNNPELGALYGLAERNDLQPGAWRLRVVPKSPSSKGRLLVTYSVNSQYELAIPMLVKKASAKSPTVVSVLALDYGKAITSLPSIHVWAEDQRGNIVASGAAKQNVTTPTGIALNSEPGVYMALFSFPAPGNYRLIAEYEFSSGKVTATQTVEVN